jgi:hypothetical protein
VKVSELDRSVVRLNSDQAATARAAVVVGCCFMAEAHLNMAKEEGEAFDRRYHAEDAAVALSTAYKYLDNSGRGSERNSMAGVEVDIARIALDVNEVFATLGMYDEATFGAPFFMPGKRRGRRSTGKRRRR